MIPGEHLVFGAVPIHVPLDIETVGGKRLEPEVDGEVFGPLLECAAVAPHVFDHGTESSVATAGDAFGERCPGVVPLELHTLGAAQVVLEQLHLAAKLFLGVLPEPLERGLRLRNKAADRDGDRGRGVVLLPQLDTVATELGDAEGVVVGLGGETREEVQLHATPALAVGRFDGAVEVFFTDELVDDLTHAPGAGFGAKVRPVRRARWSSAAIPTVKASTRSDGSATDTWPTP